MRCAPRVNVCAGVLHPAFRRHPAADVRDGVCGGVAHVRLVFARRRKRGPMDGVRAGKSF